MVPRMVLSPAVRPNHLREIRRPPSLCLFCALGTVSRAAAIPAAQRARKRLFFQPNTTTPTAFFSFSSTLPSALLQPQPPLSPPPPPPNRQSDARAELHTLLSDLLPHADPNQRQQLSLALRSLRELPGRETLRVGVHGPDGAARRLVRLVLADPLRPEQGWEREVEEEDGEHVVRVRAEEEGEGYGQVQSAFVWTGGRDGLEETKKKKKEGVDGEVVATTPTFRGSNLELTFANTTGAEAQGGDHHMALRVGEGLLGVTALLQPGPKGADAPGTSRAVVNLPPTLAEEVKNDTSLKDKGIDVVDLDAAAQALALFRQDVRNAREYEALWTRSNLSPVGEER